MKSQTTTRPWGSFTQFTHNTPSTVKIIKVNPGEELSLQFHTKREEFWKVLSGTPVITIGDEKGEGKEGQEFFIGKEVAHRIAGGESGTEILEVSLGEFDENDITRLEDRYGRV